MFGAAQLAGNSVVTEEEMILGSVLDTNWTQLQESQADSLSCFPVKSEGTVLAGLSICTLG